MRPLCVRDCRQVMLYQTSCVKAIHLLWMAFIPDSALALLWCQPLETPNCLQVLVAHLVSHFAHVVNGKAHVS